MHQSSNKLKTSRKINIQFKYPFTYLSNNNITVTHAYKKTKIQISSSEIWSWIN